MSGTSGGLAFPSEPQRPFFAGTNQTDANGDASFILPSGLFTTTPICVATVETGTAPVHYFCKVSSSSSSGCVVHVELSTVVELLGLDVLASTNPAAGVNVTLHATEAS